MLPAEYHFIELDEFDQTRDIVARRLVALDLSAARRHVEVARWETPARVPATAGAWFSATADGSRIAFVTAGQNARTLSVVLGDTRDGTVRLVSYDAAFHSTAPQLSPDGGRIAYLRLPVAQSGSFITEDGIWVMDLDRSETAPRRIVAQDPPTTTAPLGWSPDGRWLAFARLFLGGRVFAIPASGGDAIGVGPGTWASWRGWEPRLLVGGMPEPPARAALTIFDVTNRSARGTFVLDDPRSLAVRGAWHPLLDRVVYEEALRQMPLQPARVWTRYADGRAAREIASSPFIIDVWWSADGMRVYGIVGGDDSVGGVNDLLSGTAITSFCWRGDVAAPACL